MKKYFLMGFSVAIAFNAWAQAPEMFRYQGRLVDGTNLVNASLPMSFKLYDALSNGNLLYEDSSSVLVVDGLYATDIGDDTIFGSLADALTHPAVYLELTIDGETLSPREQLVSVPYALNSTPPGTIVLSATHPNPELEAQGYSLYYEDVTQADWKGIENGPIMNSPGFGVFGFENKLGVYFDASLEPNVYLTEDGKSWEEGTSPFYLGMDPETLEFNGTLFFFKADGTENAACSTTDLQSWDVWTNEFSANAMDTFFLDEMVVFKDALWAFVHDMAPSNHVMRSTDGMNWTKMADGPWGDLNIYAENILVSEDTMWVVAPEPSDYSNRIWSTTDGISWSKSASSVPTASMYTPSLIYHRGAIWSFSGSDISPMNCWKSIDNGDNWTLISTNLPVVNGSYGDAVTTHEDKMWLWGVSDSNDMKKSIYWSENGADWKNSFNSYSTSGIDLVSLTNGRLWIFQGNDGGTGESPFYYIGGPKKDDGLYYYRKD